MATPPTFVQEAEASWVGSSSPKTGTSRTYQNGDVLVGFVGVASDNNGDSDYAISGGSGFSFATQVTRPVAGDSQHSWARMFSATVVGGQTFQPTFTRVAGFVTDWGGNVLTFRGSDGIGAATATDNDTGSGAPSLSITTQADNSAIVVFVVDWNAVSGGSRTWRTVNSITPTSGNGLEVTFDNTGAGGTYVMYGAYYSDAGAAGAKTVGLTAPNTQRYVILAVEVKGTAGGGGGETITLDKWYPKQDPQRRRGPATVASGVIGIHNT